MRNEDGFSLRGRWRELAVRAGAGLGAVALLSMCTPPVNPGPTVPPPVPPGDAGVSEGAGSIYSAFGPYAGLPAWSTWCGVQPDPRACAEPLQKAVSAYDPSKQSPESRPTVRRHGWHLWAAIWSALSAPGFRNDVIERKTNLYGTTGCWSRFADGSPACGGIYPIWLTWPNTGFPYRGNGLAATAVSTSHTKPTLIEISRAHGRGTVSNDPDPTKVQTVSTPDQPTYNLPPLVLTKQCRIPIEQAKTWLNDKNYQAISDACDAAGAHNTFCKDQGKICDGVAFANQGDVMIATESLSREGYDDVENNKLYLEPTLDGMYKAKDNTVSKKIGNKYVSTKQMFWPVKACRPGASVGTAGCRVRYGALPPWVPRNFRGYDYATNAQYVGYEKWGKVIAIDTCAGQAGACAPGKSATLELAYVTGTGYGPVKTDNPDVYPVDRFVYVQVSKEVLESHFTPADRALLDQATIWAYGDASQGFEAGDFLVVAAMHVNTKEVDTWAFQSVWWSPRTDKAEDCPLRDYNHCFGQNEGYAATVARGDSAPNRFAGLSPKDIGAIDAQVGGGWREHYLMTDSYGINYEIDGTPTSVKNYFKTPPPWATTGPSGGKLAILPVSENVYIEPVTHPLGTNCHNCHERAGTPSFTVTCTPADYPKGCGNTSYQNAQCAFLLGDFGDPTKDPCMTTPWIKHDAQGDHCAAGTGVMCDGAHAFPIVSTDYIWLIADNHIQGR